MVVCGVMFASVAKVETGTQLRSASKAYPSDKLLYEMGQV